jgi:hypothetical protein
LFILDNASDPRLVPVLRTENGNCFVVYIIRYSDARFKAHLSLIRSSFFGAFIPHAVNDMEDRVLKMRAHVIEFLQRSSNRLHTAIQ